MDPGSSSERRAEGNKENKENKPEKGSETNETSRSKTRNKPNGKPNKSNNKSNNKPNNKPGNSSKSKQKPKTKQLKPKDINKDYRYLQIHKLLKTFAPITINGIAVSKMTNDLDPSKTPVDIHLDKAMATEQPVYISFIMDLDPDFPFELDDLKITLCVPNEYPYLVSALPSIYILNDEVPRGYAINVEMGFKQITKMALTGEKINPSEDGDESNADIELVNGKGLLSQILTLNKYLEVFLKQEKRKTIKIIKNKYSTRSKSGSPEIRESKSITPTPTSTPTPTPTSTYQKPYSSKTSLSSEQQKERIELINQMKLKLKSNIKLFNKNDDFEKYKVLLPINCNRDTLSDIWNDKGKLEMFLYIPSDYPLSKLSISMTKKDKRKPEEFNVMQNFNKCTFQNNNLVFILNYLSNHLSMFCLTRGDFNNYQKLLAAYK